MSKKKKLPKIAKKTYKEKGFRKKVLNKIYLPQDKAFVESMFVAENGSVRLKDDPDPKELKRLAKLGKAIKKNKGILRIGRLAVPAVLIAGILIFSLVFKDRLLANAMQSGLEYIFQARSEVEGLNLRLLAGSIEIDRIAVANQSQPMHNLFEAEDLQLNIVVPSLFERKLVITDMQIGTLQQGTPRAVSGALPAQTAESVATDAADTSDATADSLFALDLPSLSADDARRMVEDYADSLQIVQNIQAAHEFGNNTYEKWNDQIGHFSNQVDSLKDAVDDVRSLEPGKITSIAQFENARNTIQSATSTMQGIQQDVGAPLQTMRQDFSRAEQLLRDSALGYEADLDLIKSQISDLTADPGDLLLDIGMSILSEPAVEMIETVRTAHLRLQRLQSLRERFVSDDDGTEKAPTRERGGVFVAFPAQEFPTLFLGRAHSTYSTNVRTHAMELHQLSSDPSITNTAAEFLYQGYDETSSVAISGYLPFHEPDEPPVQLETVFTGLPVDIEQNIPGLGNIHLRGLADISWDTTLHSLANVGTSAQIRLDAPNLNIAGGNQTLGNLITRAVEEAGFIQMEAGAFMRSGRIEDLRGSTNLDRLIREGIQNILLEQKAAIEAAVERELRALIERERERLAPVEARLNELRNRADEIEQQLRNHQQTIYDTRDELLGQLDDWDQALRQFEERLRQQASELEDRARAEAEAAEAALRQAAQEAEEKARREAQEAARRAEQERRQREEAARRRAEEERRQREEEARKRAEEEALRRLPGF